MCPSTFLTRNFIQFQPSTVSGEIESSDTKILEKEFFVELEERSYEYTMSMTMFVNRDTCFSERPNRAMNNCHLVLFDSVFMLYFSRPNQARFHFFAERNYFESQTPKFFIPFNQWITLQMTMSQFDGYHIVVLDQDGDVLMQMSRNFNMREQKPLGKLQMLAGYSGYVSRFLLNGHRVDLPTPNYKIYKPMVNINLANVEMTSIENKGSIGMIELSRVPTLASVPY